MILDQACCEEASQFPQPWTMPISLVLTPFDHFHFRLALAVKCIPDLRVRRTLYEEMILDQAGCEEASQFPQPCSIDGCPPPPEVQHIGNLLNLSMTVTTSKTIYGIIIMP